MMHDPRRPGYIEPHRRHLDTEDMYWRARRRLVLGLTAWCVFWAAVAILALVLL